VLGTGLAIHAWVVWVGEHESFWLERRLDPAFAIQTGVWGALLIFLTMQRVRALGEQ